MIKEILNKYENVYQIQIDMPGAGFGALILVTMNQLRYCERNNLYPVVCYDNSCENAFYNIDHGNDLWAQYFEPIMRFSFEDLKSVIKLESQFRPLKLSSEEAIKISEEDSESIYPFPFGKWRFEKRGDMSAWYQEQRTKGRETLEKYIKPKPHILEKVDSFYQEYLKGGFVLGLHVRGTDLHYAPAVSPAEYFVYIDEYIQKNPELKIFLATDQLQYIDVFKDRYRERLFYIDCFRSDNEVAPFNRSEISPYSKGEDVLLDMLLLSRTDFLIKGSSNVGEMAMYFNENLECLDLAYYKTKAFGQDYGEGWDNMTNLPAWKLVSKRGLEEVAKDAASQNLLQLVIFQARKLTRYTRLWLGKMKQRARL